MLENKLTEVEGIHYTRYIESWRNMGGKFVADDFFDDWLRSEKVTEEEIRKIHEFVGMGKLELELTAKKFIEKQKKYYEEECKELEKEGYVKKKKTRKKLFGLI